MRINNHEIEYTCTDDYCSETAMRTTSIRSVRVLLLLVVSLTVASPIFIHWYRILNSLPSPFDHLWSIALKPLYKLQVLIENLIQTIASDKFLSLSAQL